MDTITIEATIAEVRRLAETMPEHQATARVVRWENPAIPKAIEKGELSFDIGHVSCTYLGTEDERTHLEVWDDDELIEAIGWVTVPRCIVGTALHNLGVPEDNLEAMEGESATSLVADVAGVDTIRDGDPIKPLYDWLDRVQNKQDAGYQWSQAVALADKEEAHL